MINRIPLGPYTEIVFSKDECGYQEVLDDFCNATKVNVLTFNISAQGGNLLELIAELDSSVEVTVISNLPNRFSTYFSDARQRARRNIVNYMNNLNPDNYDAHMNTFFNFDNHSKIIMTENIAYIGSSNFSTESEYNFECGVIIRDPGVIQLVDEQIFSFIESDSVEYHGSEISRIKLLFINLITKLQLAVNLIHDGTHSFSGHGMSDVEYFNHDPDLSPEVLEDLSALTYELEEISSLASPGEEYEGKFECLDISSIEDLRSLIDDDSKIFAMAKFDEQDFANHYLEEHANDALDERFDYYCQEAVQLASEKIGDLAEAAEEEVYRVETITNEILLYLTRTVELLTFMEQENEIIDNT